MFQYGPGKIACLAVALFVFFPYWSNAGSAEAQVKCIIRYSLKRNEILPFEWTFIQQEKKKTHIIIGKNKPIYLEATFTCILTNLAWAWSSGLLSQWILS